MQKTLINRAFRVHFEIISGVPECPVCLKNDSGNQTKSKKSNIVCAASVAGQNHDSAEIGGVYSYQLCAGGKENRMAKDGTNRGGKRIGAGRKPKPLSEKIQEGKKAEALTLPDLDPFAGPAIEDIREFLSEDQRLGDLYGKEIWDQMVAWLRQRNCAHLISPHLLEQYSMAMARWIQLEKICNEMGFLSKHPTTGAAITSPFVTMAQGYLKQANLLFQQIFSIVSANSMEPVTGNPQDDLMERLLGM